MQDSIREMLELASKAAVEQDDAKFIALIRQLNELLEPQPRLPKGKPFPPPVHPQT
jgi:hypothetical protein